MVSFSALGRLSALLVAATASTMSFDHYLSSFNKVYSGAEYVKRQDLFAARLKEIEVHNSNPFTTYKMGVNQFTDMTDTERSSFLGRAHNPKRTLTEASFKVAEGELPNTVDWRKEGVVTPVKNQGHCGSCWAFATTATVESAVAIATGKLLVLSPQNVVSCTPNNNHCGGQGGCNGATAELGFTYVMNHGIALDSTYPYKAETGTCMTDRPKAAFTTATVALAENNQDALINAVATVGPIAISVDATPWHSYQSGIFDGCSRNATLNHLVQLVGYGEEKGMKYWLVRNSWDTTWGEQGYIRVKRFDNGRDYCGTDNNPSAGSGCDGGPPTVPVCGMCGILYDSSYPIGASVATH